MPDLRVVLFSGMTPTEPYLLLDRIEQDVPDAPVVGLLYEVRRPKALIALARGWLRNLCSAG